MSTGPPKFVPKLSFGRNDPGVAANRETMGNMFSPRGTAMNYLENLITPRETKERIAAITIQTHARSMIGKVQVKRMKQRKIIYKLAYNQEQRAVLKMQNAFRQRRTFKAAQKIQAIKRGKDERAFAADKKYTKDKLEEISQNRAAKVIQKNASNYNKGNLDKVIGETRAIVEKKGKSFGIGKREIMLWQQRYIFVEEKSFCYQNVGNNQQPTGTITKVLFKDIGTVAAVGSAQMLLVTKQRNYVFNCGTDAVCEQLVKNIQWLIASPAMTNGGAKKGN